MNMNILMALGIDTKTSIGTTSSSPYTGSPTFDEVPFHVQPGQRPTLGTYVVVTFDYHDTVLYGRIFEGVEENPKADPSTLQRTQAYSMPEKPRSGDQSPFVTRVMQVEVLGELTLTEDGAITIAEPVTLPLTNMKVYELPVDKIPALLGTEDGQAIGLHLGDIEVGGRSVPFYYPRTGLSRHIALMGKTGTGKSYATGVIIEELVSNHIPVIAFDVLDDLRMATEELKGKQYEAGQNFKVPFSMVGVGEFLNFIPNLTKDQLEIVALAYARIQAKAMEQLDNTGNVTISLNDLEKEILQIGSDMGQEAVARRAFQRVNAAYKGSPLLTDKLEDWMRQLGKVPILNVFVGKLGQQQRNLVVAATARMLQVLRRRDKVSPCVFILDEAHYFLPSGEQTPSTAIIREMIRTARHDAIGVILITQSPSSIDKQVLMICNTRVIFALDREDIRAVEGTMGDVPDAVIKRLAKLPKGNAMITAGSDILRHSVRIKIRQRRTSEGAPTPDLALEAAKWLNNHNQ